MENLLLLISIFGSIWQLNCPSIQRKRRATRQLDFDNDHIRWESEHYLDYSSKREIYETWPELDRETVTNVCANFLPKLCQRKVFTSIISNVGIVDLYYREAGTTDDPLFRIAALLCSTRPRLYSRKNFYFIRSPKTDCMLLLNRRSCCVQFYISLEICEHHYYQDLRTKIKAIYTPPESSSSANDELRKLEKHEKDHLRGYLSNKVAYESWPEMGNETRREKDCWTFLRKLYPQTEFQYIRPSIQSLPLYYTRIKSSKGHRFKPKYVTSLFCHTDRVIRAQAQHFIKAPCYAANNCVFLVKHAVGKRLLRRWYHITKRLCEKDDDADGQDSTLIHSGELDRILNDEDYLLENGHLLELELDKVQTNETQKYANDKEDTSFDNYLLDESVTSP